MHHLLKASSYVICQASRTWKQAMRDVFCCHPNTDPLISPRHGLSYATFGEKQNHSYENREPLSPSSSYIQGSAASCSRSSSESQHLSSSRDEEEILEDDDRASVRTVQEVEAMQPSPSQSVESQKEEEEDEADGNLSAQQLEKLPVMKQPLGCSRVYGSCQNNGGRNILSPSASSESSLARQCAYLSYSAPAGLNHVSILSSPAEFNAPDVTNSGVETKDAQREEPEGCSETSDDSPPTLKLENTPCVTEEPEPLKIVTDKELLEVVDATNTPVEVLQAVECFVGVMSPELAVACIHHIYAKNNMTYERNSDMYNEMCGVIIRDKEFRRLLANLEHNAHKLNNFALLTAASDLLLLRLTLRKKTIPTLLSHVDVERLTLEELRLLSSCLHTPNIPLVNTDYFYNVSASIAMQELDNITDMYTLLNIMKCFGRYFTMDAKRKCERKVAELATELWDQWPDGRSKAAHMFDAFYRMEYAPNRSLLQSASNVIVNGDISIQPQDISAVFRYCVKYGYAFHDMKLLDKLSSELHKSIRSERASQFTTNVKWLTVFYYFNKPFMQTFVECVKRDMEELDFVSLSDALDALAQVYYVPDNADEFFDQMHAEMINKLPTLSTSHVHNAKRKLLLTAFHFAVYGRYPEQIIQMALSENQLASHMGHGGTKQFLVDLCRAVSIERPDLLPKFLPMHLLQNHGRPKLYAFEKDVQNVLQMICNNNYFHLMVSPACSFPFFLLQLRLDGTPLPIRNPGFIPPHRHQMVQNVAIIPLPRSRFCLGSKHAIGKTRLVLRLLRAQGARVITVPHYDWDQKSEEYKYNLLKNKIFQQKTDDVVE